MVYPFVPAKAGTQGYAMAFYVYLLANRRNGTLYVGMTDNLIGRIWQHREGVVPGFTKEYNVKLLFGMSCMKRARRPL